MASSPSNSPSDSEQRFSLDAAQAIFRRAAERQETVRAAQEAGADGLTLAELQDIGAETGVDPAHIAAAAAELETPVPDDETPWWYSGPAKFRAHRVVPGSIDDGPVWEALVGELRSTFDTDGIATQLGSTLEWSSNHREHPIRVTVTPEVDGTRIQITQSRRDAATVVPILSSSLLTLSLLFVGFVAAGNFDSQIWALPAIFAAIALLAFAVGTPLYRLYARRKQRRFENVMDRLELTALKEGHARSDASVAASEQREPTGRESQMSENVLDEAPESSESPSRSRNASHERRSTRS